jgi:hypothetical protein
MSEKKSQGIKFLKRLGLVIIIVFIVIIIIAIITPDQGENLDQAQEAQSNQEVQKVLLNSCKLDEANADYWQGKQVNFWDSAERESVAFTLPACDDLELEIIDVQEVDNIEVYQVRYQDKKGWISKVQLFK